ncbi:MAG TPA: hypothetical protein VGD76_04650 [Ramlibacter sp.]
MAERTSEQTLSGAVLSISASLPATYDAAGYGATSVAFTAVGSIEQYGDHGGTANVSRFTPVATGVTNKLKGAIDYGVMNLIMAYIPSDSGQDIVEAAFASKNHYSVKIAYPAGAGETTGEIHYLDVLVTKRVWQDGAVDDVRKLAVDLEVCKPTVIVAGS